MRRRNESQAQVLEFWRAVEMLAPQPVPEVRPAELVFPVYPGGPLPWQPGHEIEDVPLPAGMTWRHTVYGGIFPLRHVRAVLERVFGAEPEPPDAPGPGNSALCAITVTQDGRPLLGTQELSCCAWVLGRTSDADGDPDAGDWWEGFGEAAAACDRDLRRLLAAPEGDADAAELNARLKRAGLQAGRPLGHAELAEFCDRVETELGVGTALRPAGSRIRSVPVPERVQYDGAACAVLNSPVAADLDRVAQAVRKGDHGAALDGYLGGAKSAVRDRIDVRKDPATVYEGVAPELVPAARWPARSERALSLSQQFTVNTVLTDLAPGAGLFSVHGPPGTGRTAMLQDLVAAVVVERARRLAALPATHAAFGQALRWKSAEHTRVINTWKAQLTGFEMVLATGDERAAAGAAGETAHEAAIDEEWRDEAGYLPDLATAVLQAGAYEPAADGMAGIDGMAGADRGPLADADPDQWPDLSDLSERADSADPEEPADADGAASEALERAGDTTGGEADWPWGDRAPERAWGLLAAALGEPRSRRRFVTAFWLGDREAGTPGMRDILDRDRPKATAWRKAVRDFRKAERATAELMNKRAKIFSHVTTLPHAERERSLLEQERQRAQQVVADLQRRIAQESRPISALSRVAAERERERHAHLERRPGRWETLFARSRARRWQDRESELTAAIAHAEQRLNASEGTLTHLKEMHAAARTGVTEHEDRLAALTEQVSAAQTAIRRARQDLPDALPVRDWWDNPDRRELAAPWTDAAWNAARTRLFLAALELHRAFLAAEAGRMRKNLLAAMDVLLGNVPAAAPKEAVLAAWQSLFFVVPMVVTPCDTVDRVFARLDREALGWLFVDDAGQVAPQRAVGAIWRAQRAVVVGDPFHLEPVEATPLVAQQAARGSFGVNESWLPGRISAQRLADQGNRYGTSLPGPGGRVWVGAPLRVQRRRDAPMFAISNAVAYDGSLVDGVPRRGPVQSDSFPAPPDSKWIDITGGTAEGHWIPAEGEELRFVLRRLRRQCGITSDRVAVVSPFRQVADRLERIAERFPGLAAGTVHATQGRRPDIVIFVLGGGPDAAEARKWAAGKPNLVNSVVGAAQRRLYVIGDHAAWSSHRYFDALAAGLPVTTSIRPVQDGADLERGEAAGTA